MVGKHEILRKEVLIWAIFGAQIFGSQTRPVVRSVRTEQG